MKLQDPRYRGWEVRRGRLLCDRCHTGFFITAGIPVMLKPGTLADWTQPFTKILIGDLRLNNDQKRRQIDPLEEYARKHGLTRMKHRFSSFIKGEYEPPATFWERPVDRELLAEGAYRIRRKEVEKHLKRIEQGCKQNRSVQEQALLVAQLRPRTLVDICCGGGFFTGWLLKTFRQYERLFALDIDYNCVKRLEGVFRHYGVLKRSTPLVADVTALPFPSDSVELVTSWLGDSHVLGYSKGLKEAFRILKPRGHFIATNRIEPKIPHQGLTLEEVVQVSRRADLYIDKENYLERLRGSGFSIEEVKDIDTSFLTICTKSDIACPC